MGISEVVEERLRSGRYGLMCRVFVVELTWEKRYEVVRIIVDSLEREESCETF